jgi:tartrate dehydratase beta subunit/fumarate hydratase class I family protein
MGDVDAKKIVEKLEDYWKEKSKWEFFKSLFTLYLTHQQQKYLQQQNEKGSLTPTTQQRKNSFKKKIGQNRVSLALKKFLGISQTTLIKEWLQKYQKHNPKGTKGWFYLSPTEKLHLLKEWDERYNVREDKE